MLSNNTRVMLTAVLIFAVPTCLIALVLVEWQRLASSRGEVWTACISGGIVVLAGALLAMHALRQDVAPDYLRAELLGRRPLESDGLTFILAGDAVDGVHVLRVLWQNRYERECTTVIVVRAKPRFLPSAARAWQTRITIEAPGGGFGETCMPMALPHELAGKDLVCEVSGHTDYPLGRGRMLRTRMGELIDHESVDKLAPVLPVLSLLAGGGGLLWVRPVRCLVQFPVGAAAPPREPIEATTRVYKTWARERDELGVRRGV